MGSNTWAILERIARWWSDVYLWVCVVSTVIAFICFKIEWHQFEERRKYGSSYNGIELIIPAKGWVYISLFSVISGLVLDLIFQWFIE